MYSYQKPCVERTFEGNEVRHCQCGDVDKCNGGGVGSCSVIVMLVSLTWIYIELYRVA